MGGLIAGLTLLAKRISALAGSGTLFSGRPDLSEMDLSRDWPFIERLLTQEEWPFVRGDLEASLAQPRHAAWVARKEGRFAAFFVAHAFGDVGYLDMMIVDPEFRGRGVARPLYSRTVRDLRRQGVRSFVVHTTNDSARLIRLLGFRPGRAYALLARDPGAAGDLATGPAGGSVVPVGAERMGELLDLDARAFGICRREWVGALLGAPGAQFFGWVREGRLTASVCLRERRGGAACLDMAVGIHGDDLEALIGRVVAMHAGRRLECFALSGSSLQARLEEFGFLVPDFFSAIGPLVEWRRGPVGAVGTSARFQCLSWF